MRGGDSEYMILGNEPVDFTYYYDSVEKNISEDPFDAQLTFEVLKKPLLADGDVSPEPIPPERPVSSYVATYMEPIKVSALSVFKELLEGKGEPAQVDPRSRGGYLAAKFALDALRHAPYGEHVPPRVGSAATVMGCKFDEIVALVFWAKKGCFLPENEGVRDVFRSCEREIGLTWTLMLCAIINQHLKENNIPLELYHDSETHQYGWLGLSR